MLKKRISNKLFKLEIDFVYWSFDEVSNKYTMPNYDIIPNWVTAVWDYEILLRINSDIKNSNILWVLSHELIHCMSIRCESLGIKYDYNNDETHAYLMEYLMVEITDFLNKKWIINIYWQ